MLALTTGGTLDKVYSAQGRLEVGPPCLPTLLEEAGAQDGVLIVEVMRKDSLDINDDDQRALCQYVRDAPHHRVLITHGTDTMVETALLLRGLCPEKTIVLTGAVQPHSMRRSDAAFNVGFTLGALSTPTRGLRHHERPGLPSRPGDQRPGAGTVRAARLTATDSLADH